jgi:hypothetical protein
VLKYGRPQGARTPPPGPCLSALRLPGAEVGSLRQRLTCYRITRSSRPSRTRSRYLDRHADTERGTLQERIRSHTVGQMLGFIVLVLIIRVTFGWHVAAMRLVPWLIGYVAFWLFKLFKPVKTS